MFEDRLSCELRPWEEVSPVRGKRRKARYAHLADSYRSGDLIPPFHRLSRQDVRQQEASRRKYSDARLPPSLSSYSLATETPCESYYSTSYQHEWTSEESGMDEMPHRMSNGEDVGEGRETGEEGDEGEEGEDGNGGEDGRIGCSRARRR